jgi:hypothetical protein
MPYPILIPGITPKMSRTPRSPSLWPAYPDIPIYLEAADERRTNTKTYGTTPTTPTTPEVMAHNKSTHLSPAQAYIPQSSPVDPSPTTTIQTSSDRSIIWPIPEPPPEIQDQHARRPALRFFPTQRPRIRLDSVPTLQIPQLNEKTPIINSHPGLGILNGLPKPPSIEVSSPVNEKSESTFNFAQRIEEKLWRYSASGNTLKRWLLEILSWIFSAICMGAIIGVLIFLKDDSLSKWTLAEKTGLTLNTFISILSKMAGAALILPVSEALGQLKWSWFLENSKQMWDFEIFDNASRGPWGSMLLLLRTKGKALAALGAMIMLCSLALDPFFQQVVDFPDRWALQNTSSAIPRAVHYNPRYNPIFFQGFEDQQNEPAMQATIVPFLYDNGTQPVPFGNGTRPEIPLSCPTSNCTWPDYETFAVCSKCAKIDASELLTYTCMNTTIDWTADYTGPISAGKQPNGTVCGYFLNATSTTPILMSGYILNGTDPENNFGEALLVRSLPLTTFLTKKWLFGTGSIRFKDIRNPIVDALIVSAAKNSTDSVYRREVPIIHECVLSWCVQTMRSSYDWGKYSEEIISTFENTTAGPSPWESFEIPEEEGGGQFLIYNQNITIRPPEASPSRLNDTVFDNSYGANNVSVGNVINIFSDFFPSYYTGHSTSKRPLLRYRNWPQGAYTKTLDFNPWESSNNVTLHMERLASAMTKVLRSATSKVMTEGNAYVRETYVSVRWEWLTLPLGLLCIAFIFLAATIAKSAVELDRVGVWKTSAYATLLYGLPDEMQKKLTRSASTGTPRAKAKELKVKLQPNGGWRASGLLFSPFITKPKVNQPPPGWI